MARHRDRTQGHRRPRIALLTRRERQVMDMLVTGRKNKTIAEELGISRKTLDIHRSKVMSKMAARTVADLVRWSYMDNPKQLADYAPVRRIGRELSQDRRLRLSARGCVCER